MPANRALIAGGSGAAAILAYLLLAPSQNGSVAFKTPGMANIENRYTAAGGAPNSAPPTASKRGDSSSSAPADGTKESGVGTPAHEKNFGEQRDRGSSTSVQKGFNKGVQGQESGR